MTTTEDKKPVWGAPPTTGAWAAQVEEEEAANGGELEPMPTPVEAPKPFRAGGADRAGFSALAPEAFPSLGETANVKETKKDKKKKQQKIPLSSFMAASTARKEEVINLPTAPRARSEDDAPKAGLGGGFKNYGGDRGGGFGDRVRDEDRGFGDRDREEDEGPSRADAADDWGVKKAFVPSGAPSRGGGGGGFGERQSSGGFGDRDRSSGGFGERDSFGRADTEDRWGSKTFEPSKPRMGGFEDRPSGIGSSRDEDLGPSRADTEDRWSRRSQPLSTDTDSRWGGSRRGDVRSGSPPPASGGSRPRLNLKPRSSDLPLPPLAPPSTSRSGSRAGSETGSEEAPVVVPRSGPRADPFGGAKPVAVRDKPEPSPPLLEEVPEVPEVPAAPKPRSNPFGAARPRDEVLKERSHAVEGMKADEGSAASDAGEPGSAPLETSATEGAAEAAANGDVQDGPVNEVEAAAAELSVKDVENEDEARPIPAADSRQRW